MLDEQTRYRLLKLVEAQPELSQRQLALALGVSVGKVNYCLNALMEKGLVKARNFRNSKNKLAYMYFLTPAGIEEKARVSIRYLRLKLREYDSLRLEIEALQLDARRLGFAAADDMDGLVQPASLLAPTARPAGDDLSGAAK